MRQKTIYGLVSIWITFLCLAFSSVNAQAPSGKIIKGTVLNNSGIPLAGATIVVKGEKKSATTNEKGEFSIEPSATQKVQLVISYVGYITRTEPVEGKSTLEIRLSENPAELSNVVVVGYGSVKKSDLTGSVVSIKANELNATPATTFDQALQGRAAGVQVTQMSGKPGAETSIRIRGTSSVNAGNEPLYVIDGLLISTDGSDISAGGTRGPRISALSSLNPTDIESIEVLKDASATAMYGARGANGVVLITTKRGKNGKGVLTFDTYQGVQHIANKLHLLNAAQFASFVNDAKINSGQVPIYVNPANLGAGTDWQDALFRNANMGNYQLSFSGGDAKTKYAISGGFFNQDGIIISSNFKRYSFRSNVESKLSDKVTVGANLSYSRISSNGVLTNDLGQIVPGVVTSAILFNPVLPIYDSTQPAGYTFENKSADGYFNGKTLGNPIAEAQNYISTTVLSRFLGNTFLQYNISKALSLKTTFGVDAFTNNEYSFGPNFLKRTQASMGEASIGTTTGLTWLNENTINYNKSFNQHSVINAVAGFTLQQFNNEMVYASAFDFPDNRTGWHNLSVAQQPQPTVNNESQWSMVSYLGRINYTLDNKYLFTATSRIDGSSKFGANNKYGFFPSGAFAWRVSKEKFMDNVKAINDLKFRSSYGIIGNQAIPPYQSLALVGPYGQGVFNSGTGSEVYNGQEPLSYNNPNLKWETTHQLDLGIDLSMFHSRINFTADYYEKKTDNLLLSVPIPLTTGFSSTLLNIGNIENHGVDLELRTINLQGKVEWTSALNFSVNRNKMTYLNNQTDVILDGVLLLRQGQSIGTFYGYKADGIFQSNAEAASSATLVGQTAQAGDRKYVDVTPDGKIDANDRTIIGSAQPKFTWGFTNTVSYKNVELSFFLQGSQGNQMANLNNLNLLNFQGTNNVLADAALDRWTPTNHSNKNPRALANATDVGTISSNLIEDASYVRLKSVVLSYTLPEKAIRKIGMSNFRIFASGTNLFTITKYTGFDPEANTSGQSTSIVGIDFGGYPQSKIFQLGLSASF